MLEPSAQPSATEGWKGSLRTVTTCCITLPNPADFCQPHPTQAAVEVEPAVEAGAEAATPAEVEPTKLAPAETAPAETAPVKTAPAETAPAETAPAETAPAGAAPAASGVKRKAAPLPRVTMHGSQDVPSHRVHPTRMCNPNLQAGP